MYKHSIICNKPVISGQCVILSDFDHLDLTAILKTGFLEHFVAIKEEVYPELFQYFYSNLSFVNNHVKSRIKDVDINIFLERFVRIFRLSCDAVEIFFSDLHDFEYLNGESALTPSHLLHDDDNLAFVRNKEVKRYMLRAQILAKIVLYNLLSK